MMPTILVPFVGLGLLSLAGVRVTCRFDARQPLAAGDDHRWPLRHARAGFRDCGGLLIACGYWISLDSL
jgi:hypothetical protein